MEAYERKKEKGPTMVDDTVLQQSLAQVDTFLWVWRLPNFHQPRNKLTLREKEKSKLLEESERQERLLNFLQTFTLQW